MALRHPFPNTVLPDFRTAVAPDRAPPATRKAKEVSFRTGKDMAAVVAELLGLRSVKVLAAVGSGKSTKLPRQLAKDAAKVVLHVLPSRLMAVDLYDYLSTLPGGDKFKLCLEPQDSYPEDGVAITWSACVIARVLIFGVKNGVCPLGEDRILYLDESHESDGFTSVLANIATFIPGVSAVLTASATHSADRSPMRETPGVFETRTFPKSERPGDWDPLEVGKPWSMSSFEGNALLLVDSDEYAARLMAKYNAAGAAAYRLSSKMEVSAFREAMRMMRDPNAGIVVLIADYSFRSSFTMDVSVIIDSGVVKYHEVVDGKHVVRYRVMYELERVQGSARGARTPGSSCVYWSPDYNVQQAICTLEGVESELAATLYRYLGYLVPVELRGVACAEGLLPLDFVSAANGTVPFPLLANSMKTSMLLPKREAVVEPQTVSVEDVLNGYGTLTPPGSPVDYFQDLSIPAPAKGFIDQQGGLQFLQQLQAMSGTTGTIVVGMYYSCNGLPSADVDTALYGRDWKRAMREITMNPDLVLGLEDYDRHELTALLLGEYNAFVGRANGIERMLESQESLQAVTLAHPNIVREWSDVVATDLREARSMSKALAGVLESLKTKNLQFVPLDSDGKVERSVGESYAGQLVGAIKALQVGVDGEAYMGYVQGKIGMGTTMSALDSEKMSIDRGGGTSNVRVRVVPSRVGAKRTQDLTFTSDTSGLWDRNDYKRAVEAYLDWHGLDVGCIRKLTFGASKVDAGAILQELRDCKQYKRRHSRSFKVAVAVPAKAIEE